MRDSGTLVKEDAWAVPMVVAPGSARFLGRLFHRSTAATHMGSLESGAAPKGDTMQVLVAGATGYIGRRLVPRLLAGGHAVRALARNPQRASTVLPLAVEVVSGDVLRPENIY